VALLAGHGRRGVGRRVRVALTVTFCLFSALTAAVWIYSYEYAVYGYHTRRVPGNGSRDADRTEYGFLLERGRCRLDRVSNYYPGSPTADWPGSHCWTHGLWVFGQVCIETDVGQVVLEDTTAAGLGCHAVREATGEVGIAHLHLPPAGKHRSDTPPKVAQCTSVYFPMWLVLCAALAPILPRVGLAQWRRWRAYGWRRSGRCPGCGYDVRASNERCPECGRSLGVAPPAEPTSDEIAERLGRIQ